MKIAENPLLTGSVLSATLLIGLGYMLPWPFYSSTIDLSLVVASGLIWLRSLPETIQIVFYGSRNEEAKDGDGSHLAVYGANLIGLGGLIAAISSLMLAVPALAPYVSHTPLEKLGRGIATFGIFMWFISPSVNRHGIRFTGGAWLYVGAALAMAAVYAIGYSAGFKEEQRTVILDDDHIPDDRPRCLPGRAVWGSTGGRYHIPASPHRRTVFPQRCFATEEEAIAAGFRAPG